MNDRSLSPYIIPEYRTSLNNFIKPTFNQIDIDIVKADLSSSISKLPSFDAVINKNYKYLKSYISEDYIYKNVTNQTALMLACYIGDLIAVKCLIDKEIGHVDLFDRSALYYANNSLNKSDLLIDIISKYELF